MSKAKKTTTFEEDVRTVKAPQLFGDNPAGMVEVERIEPPAGYLETCPADEVDAETIKGRFGPGTYMLTWFPPDDAEPQKKRLQIAGKPFDYAGDNRGRRGGGGNSGLVEPMFREMMRTMRQQQQAGPGTVEGEMMKLFELQRAQASQSLEKLATILGASQQQTVAVMQASAENAQRTFEAQQLAASAAHERSLADQSAQHERMLAMVAQLGEARTAAASPLGGVGQLAQMAEMLDKLRGGDGDKKWYSTLAEMAPGLLDALGSNYERAASAAAQVRAAKAGGIPAPGPYGIDPGGLDAGGPLPALPQPAAPAQLPVQSNPSVAPDPAASPPPTSGDGAAEGFDDTDDGAWTEFTTWLATLKRVPDAMWPNIIIGQAQAGELPLLLVEPLTKAQQGEPDELVALFEDAGEGELLQRALVVLSSARASAAGGNDATTTPEPQRPDAAGTDPTVEPDGTT